MGKTVSEKIIENHLVSGKLEPGSEIALRIDHTLTQDATGTMAFLEFMAVGVPRVKTEVSVSYVDHNLLQADFRNADDHRFLRSVAAKFGVVFSRPGNGVSHQVHLERFSVPGKTLLGSDSHTPTNAGSSMLAIGAGGLDVAMAMAGKPFYMRMPQVVGVRLTGALQPWVSAKDVILEMLRRLTVRGGIGKIFEYFGPGVETLSATDRATIGNMGTELGASTSVFPSDSHTREFLESQGRGQVWTEILPDSDARYADVMEIDLSELEPLIACPSSPDNVKKVSEVQGIDVGQVIVGSSVNSSFRDLMIVGRSREGETLPSGREFRDQPGKQPGATERGLQRRRFQPDPQWRAHPSVGMPGLHWHGTGSRDRHCIPEDVSKKLPRSQRNAQRSGISLLPGNRGRGSDLREDYRPKKARRLS